MYVANANEYIHNVDMCEVECEFVSVYVEGQVSC